MASVRSMLSKLPASTSFSRSVALLNLCISVHWLLLTSALTISRVRSSGIAASGSALSSSKASTRRPGTGTKKSRSPSLYHMVLSLERATNEMPATVWSGGSQIVARCRGTLEPDTSTSHSSSLHSSSSVSHAVGPPTIVSSGHSSSGGRLQLRVLGLLMPQCSTSPSARSVITSTRTGIAGSSCRTTATSSAFLVMLKRRFHLRPGSSVNCAMRKSIGRAGGRSSAESLGAELSRRLMRSSGLRERLPSSGLPTSAAAACALAFGSGGGASPRLSSSLRGASAGCLNLASICAYVMPFPTWRSISCRACCEKSAPSGLPAFSHRMYACMPSSSPGMGPCCGAGADGRLKPGRLRSQYSV
mmetsp:Transcript_25666/g.75967  ORF Transcript_25666/g.75967 Transcript_25666/m.75967 type:complete len:360 (-) Transcript_25666:755-1834(-)